jgi:glycosyltransferase involved in cell wall biosynthesis
MNQPKFTLMLLLSSQALGGMEMRAARLARLSAERGHFLHFGCPSGSRLDRLLESYGISRCHVDIHGSIDLFSCWKLATFFKRNNVRLVMSFTGKDWWMTILAARLAKIPVVLSRSTPYPLSRFSVPVVKKADKIVAVSRGIRDMLVRQGFLEQNITVIYLGVDTSKFSVRSTPSQQEVRRELGLPQDKLIVGCLGRPRKGQQRLLEADRSLRSECPDLRYFFAGAGIPEALGPRIREQPGLEDRVVLRDLLPHDKMPSVLKALDLVAHIPEREPFSNAVLEAMAMQKPMILSRTLGNVEAAEEGKSALFVDPNDLEEVANKLKHLYRSPDLRENLGQSALTRVQEFFDEERMINEMENLWAGLIHS